ncbi:MAG: hypothetical protein KDC73_02795 [Ignavibacteriae bacterium]|nr:hypothetical protein [Ignavibacteriota bacterium]MCB9244352.1 hypothetical protein [Ignavibacteriales bacterium]
MHKRLSYLLIIITSVLVLSCGDGEKKPDTINGEGFQWKENISIADIPDTPLKGMLRGKEINFEYINFEQWRGSGDNVFNFGSKKPEQNCGYVENDEAFHLMRKSGEITTGEVLKSNFSSTLDGYFGDFHYNKDGEIEKVSVEWNCALVITEMNDSLVKGKIAMCFNSPYKSWIAGTFEALRCYN